MLRHVEIAAGMQHVGFAAWQGSVMERIPVTASPIGGGRLSGWTACLGSSRPMSSAG